MKKEEELIDKGNFSFRSVGDKCQLFLLHFGGGSCYSFDFLRQYIKEGVEFISLELPGRGKRYDENLIFNKRDAIADYTRQIKSLRNDHPYLIYGHSMGATLGLSVTKHMEDCNDAPAHLVVSGNAGPGVKDINEKGEKIRRYLMNDCDFKEELRRLGGMPKEVLENNELFTFFNPIMRADFEVLEKDNYSEKGIELRTPIYALMGSEEKYQNHIQNWNNFTTSDFNSQVLEGNHFFINNHPQELAKVIYNCITSSTVVN